MRPTVFLAAHALAALLLGLVVIVPGVSFLQDQRHRIEQGTLALERAHSALSRNEVVAALTPEQIATAANRYIQGDSEGLQNADLLGRLHRAAQEQGVSLRSATPLAPRAWNNRRLVGARIEFTAPTDRAAGFLAGIEDGAALLFIDQASLSHDADGGTDALAVVIEIYGVARWTES
ncbi:type II secretion system protein GspM [Microvirga sp. 0TCS3.31]